MGSDGERDVFADCDGIVADDNESRSHVLVAFSYGGPVDLRLRSSIALSGIWYSVSFFS
jgi:hypothetical protein